MYFWPQVFAEDSDSWGAPFLGYGFIFVSRGGGDRVVIFSVCGDG